GILVGNLAPRDSGRPTIISTASLESPLGGPSAAERRSTHPDMVGPVKPPPPGFSHGPWDGAGQRPAPSQGRLPVGRQPVTATFFIALFSGVFLWLSPGEGQGDRSRRTSLRRLISLISAGWLPA